MPGSQTTPNRTKACDSASARAAFHVEDRVSVRDRNHFRGSMAGLCVPRTTLRRRPHERLRMPQGHCGSLLLQCSGLAPPTPRRFCRRTLDAVLALAAIVVKRKDLGSATGAVGDEEAEAGSRYAFPTTRQVRTLSGIFEFSKFNRRKTTVQLS